MQQEARLKSRIHPGTLRFHQSGRSPQVKRTSQAHNPLRRSRALYEQRRNLRWRQHHPMGLQYDVIHFVQVIQGKRSHTQARQARYL